MGRSINRITIVGNVGRDPEVRVTKEGAKVANVSVATNWRTGGDKPEDRTDWHRVNFWGRLAQVAEDFVNKGDRVFIEGHLAYDSFERDGVTIPTAEIRATDLILLSSRPTEAAA